MSIPAFPTRPDSNGDAFSQQAGADDTTIYVVNVMTMDFCGGFDTGGANTGTYATETAPGTR